jgi:serine/threonine protein phosphatase PrpC
MDGHGPTGHTVSQFLRDKLDDALRDTADKMAGGNSPDAMALAAEAAFTSVNEGLLNESGIDCEFSGSTAVAVVLAGHHILSFNVGDSRAVLAKRMSPWEFEAVPLSCDHKPSRPDIKAAVIAAGGRVEPKRGIEGTVGSDRVWLQDRPLPGLAVGRAFGDAIANSVGVVPTPECWARRRQANDSFVILASDGVWEFITSQEAVDIVAQGATLEEGAQTLLAESKERWAEDDYQSRDDITVIVVNLAEKWAGGMEDEE